MRRPERSVECSDSEKKMSAYADQNHAPSLTCVRLEFLVIQQHMIKIQIIRIVILRCGNGGSWMLIRQTGQKIRDIETEYLSWTDEDSQIAKLNAASGETTEVSDELAGYLEKIFQLAKDSNGAFDPTIGKIIRLWDITGENPHVPEQSELDELLKDVGYQKVSLDGDKVTLEKGATLDLGATGK